MAEVTMFLWVLAAAAGMLMFGQWAAYGTPGEPSHSHLPEPLVLSHAVLAAVGALVWLVYLLVRAPTVAWLGFALASAVSMLGLVMFARWLPVRGSDEDYPEQYFPVPVVAVHGMFAVAIVVLTLFSALGIG